MASKATHENGKVTARFAAIRSTAGIRSLMFDELERLLNDEIDPMRMNSVARACSEITKSAYYDLDVAKFKSKMGQQTGAAPKLSPVLLTDD